MRRASVLLSLFVFASPALAETLTAGPCDDVESLIGTLEPGDELILDDGTYTLDGSRFSFDLAGTEAMPIVIRAADGARPHFHRPNASQNIWDIRAEHLIIRGLAFSGGSAGLRFESGRFVTLEGCEIFDTADVALRMNDGGQRYEGMRILRNEIHHTNGTGEGMYLGCNSNACQLANSLIEGNYVHRTNQSSVSQGDGIEIKEGSFGNAVRDNVIHDTNYPCILTYATAGNGEPNVLERNVMWGCGDHAIQSAADATIRNNLILGAVGAGIAMQPHQAGTPSNLVVVHNTILNAGNPIARRGATGSVVIANNALYTGGSTSLFTNGDTSRLVSVGNVGNGSGPGVTAGSIAADRVMASLGGAPPMNLRGVSIRGGAEGFRQRARYNAIFAGSALSADNAEENVVGTYEDASSRLRAPHAAAGSLDLHPNDLSALAIEVGDVLPEGAELDFEGHPREDGVAGAFVAADGAPLSLDAPPVPR